MNISDVIEPVGSYLMIVERKEINEKNSFGYNFIFLYFHRYK